MTTVTFIVNGAEVKPVIATSTRETILGLKQRIQAYTGVGISRQILRHGKVELENRAVIAYYSFPDVVTVGLEVEPLPSNEKLGILVTADALGTELEYEVKETDTVLSLKRKIGKDSEVAPEDMALWHLAVEMKDEQTLSKYYINEGSKVSLRSIALC